MRAYSKAKQIYLSPAGIFQGTYMGGLIFIIKYNGAFLRPSIPRPMKGAISQSKSEAVKYIDDGNYDQRTEHMLPSQNNLLQCYLEDTLEFISVNNMVLQL